MPHPAGIGRVLKEIRLSSHLSEHKYLMEQVIDKIDSQSAMVLSTEKPQIALTRAAILAKW